MLNFLCKNIFTKSLSPEDAQIVLTTDVHSHLLPGIDDGVKTLEEAARIIEQFIDLGYKKLITTPHIMNDFYKNTPEHEKLDTFLWLPTGFFPCNGPV